MLDPCLELDSRPRKAIRECVILANYVIEAVVVVVVGGGVVERSEILLFKSSMAFFSSGSSF